jgi:hypothetical protein
MQPSDELKNIVLQNFKKEAAGEILEVVRNSYSHENGAIVVGSEPDQWFEGYDSIYNFYKPADGTGLDIRVDVLKAYREGSVGWTVDRVWLKLPNGNEVSIRHTRIFHQEDGGWKVVHNHVSVPISDDKVGE